MRLLAISLLAFSASAAVIQGVVLEEETGNPLARTTVNLIPLPGAHTGAVSVRSGDRGAFTLNNVAPGWYVLRCTRRGFVPAEVGRRLVELSSLTPVPGARAPVIGIALASGAVVTVMRIRLS